MKGKICIDRYCTMESHKKKKVELKLNHWYTTQPGSTSVYVTPTLDAAIASNSSIWSMYEKGLHHAPAWDSIMSYVRSNAAASTVGAMLTEAASSAVVLGSFGDTNPIPKTPSLRRLLQEETLPRPAQKSWHLLLTLVSNGRRTHWRTYTKKW